MWSDGIAGEPLARNRQHCAPNCARLADLVNRAQGSDQIKGACNALIEDLVPSLRSAAKKHAKGSTVPPMSSPEYLTVTAVVISLVIVRLPVSVVLIRNDVVVIVMRPVSVAVFVLVVVMVIVVDDVSVISAIYCCHAVLVVAPFIMGARTRRPEQQQPA